MRADWEVEIGPGAPVIEAQWPGWIDLQQHPERAGELSEAAQLPALAPALVLLNAHHSPVWTAKCDIWPLDDGANLDPDELHAEPGSTTHVVACYIDLLPRTRHHGTPPNRIVAANVEENIAAAISQAQFVCRRLLLIPLTCCRMDMVLRRAFLTHDTENIGTTAYLTACGATESDARHTLESAVMALAKTIVPDSTLK